MAGSFQNMLLYEDLRCEPYSPRDQEEGMSDSSTLIGQLKSTLLGVLGLTTRDNNVEKLPPGGNPQYELAADGDGQCVLQNFEIK